ncbi:surface-adhesin E family protein [Leptolyngbya sp. AN02str]|uniref:surface-adhesin E family protein n=1 Tax=Leptolyngbya sp. AN02str TaxID=3423363 RepID=UPI003D31D62B
MKTLLIALVAMMPAVGASGALAQSTQPTWVEVTRNAVGDRFMVERDSIDLRDDVVWFWEYRDFPEPNNAFVGVELEQPVHGAMLYRSVDCVSGVSRLRQMVVHNRERQVIQRFNYGNAGQLAQPQSGSSAAAVLSFVCEQSQPEPNSAPQ